MNKSIYKNNFHHSQKYFCKCRLNPQPLKVVDKNTSTSYIATLEIQDAPMAEEKIQYVNVSFTNIYRQATFHSEIDTQAILWEELLVLEESGLFRKVQTEDGYKGWINIHQIAASRSLRSFSTGIITQPHVFFYEDAQRHSQLLRDGFAGMRIPLLQKTEGWIKTCFPDGTEAWVEEEALQPLPGLSREHLIAYARRFLGVTYFWGGKTPRGFDCSGFVQFIHKLFGIQLRRDSWMQFEDSRFVSDQNMAGQPGDLMFFSESGERITHVGFCLGSGLLLHARGMVRVNSLQDDHALFDATLCDHFVAIKTFL